ncbi:thioredoxin family protein [Trichothermofontia sp.]
MMSNTTPMHDNTSLGRDALHQLQASSEHPILVKFFAPHCSACETLAPVLQKLATEYADQLHLITIDMTEEPELAMELGIRSAPTVVLFRKQNILEKVAGLKPKQFYAELIEKAL